MEECESARRAKLFAMEPVETGCSVPIALNVASAVDDRIIDCNATKTNPIAPNTDACIFGCGGNDARGGADGNDFISASGCINAGQCVKPGEAWSAAPAGTTVLGSGPTWGVYETASGEQTWAGVSATSTDVSTGSVIDGDGDVSAPFHGRDQMRPSACNRWRARCRSVKRMRSSTGKCNTKKKTEGSHA